MPASEAFSCKMYCNSKFISMLRAFKIALTFINLNERWVNSFYSSAFIVLIQNKLL
jgi:hypothetical protein